MDKARIEQAVEIGLRTLKVSAPLSLSEWATKNFYLSSESSYVEQSWKAYPYQTDIMDCLSNDDINEIYWMKSARVGYTKIILASMGYYAQHKMRNQAVWQPTDDDSDDFCKTELEPMLRDVKCMEAVFPSFMQRHKDNTLKQKKFLGSILHLRGGKAAKNYRRISIDVGYLDELDGFDLDIEKEGSPINLARKRTEGATFPKLIAGSTPKLKHFSMIERRVDLAKQYFRFNIPCPHCGEMHQLTWGGPDKSHGFKWTDDDPSTVSHLCPHCGSLYDQNEYLSVWSRGKWISKTCVYIENGDFYDQDGTPIEPPETVAFHIWTAYSPQATWENIVTEFLSAQKKAEVGDTSELKTFVNTTLGETWEEGVDKTDEHSLMQRAEDYRLRTVPDGGLVLVAGVDVQDDRFEIVVWAIGRGEEMWVVDYMVIHANPADERDWGRLDNYLMTEFESGDGVLRIESTAIDTGGHFTHQVYNFCRVRTRRRIYAVKGDNQPGKPVKGKSSLQDVNYRGRVIKSGVKLWHIGVDTAKDLLHGRLKITKPGPGCVHFSKGLPHEFYYQLTAENRVLTKSATGTVYRWQKVRSRNEVLDCTVYAMFAANMRGLNSYTEVMWDRLENRIVNNDDKPIVKQHKQPNRNNDSYRNRQVQRQRGLIR